MQFFQDDRSPSSAKLFSIGWNWDKVRVLKFFSDTHTRGVTLLQRLHFVVASASLQMNIHHSTSCIASVLFLLAGEQTLNALGGWRMSEY